MTRLIRFLGFGILTIFCLLGLLLVSWQTTYAQCENIPLLDDASGTEKNNFFFVVFDKNTDWDDTHQDLVGKALKTENWIVFSPTILEKAKKEANAEKKAVLFNAATPSIATIVPDGSRGLIIKFSDFDFNSDSVTEPYTLQKNETYMVKVADNNDFVPDDCIGRAKQIEIEPQSGLGGGSSSQNPPAKSKKIVIGPAKERDDADIYIEGVAEGARKEKTTFTVDASISKRFPFGKKKLGYYWKPFFNIKASSSEDADPDSLNFGVGLGHRTKTFSKNFLKIDRLRFTEAAKFEADRDFKNVNLVGDFRMKVSSELLRRKLFRIPVDIVPFFGMEIGKNLKSPLDETQGKMIARPLFGATLYAVLYDFDKENQSYEKTLSFETFYERRFLLKKEIALDTDDDGNFIGVPISRAPRDYLKSSLTYNFTENFGFKLNYEYGSLPPLFKLVDSKFSVGLVFKGVFSKK